MNFVEFGSEKNTPNMRYEKCMNFFVLAVGFLFTSRLKFRVSKKVSKYMKS